MKDTRRCLTSTRATVRGVRIDASYRTIPVIRIYSNHRPDRGGTPRLVGLDHLHTPDNSLYRSCSTLRRCLRKLIRRRRDRYQLLDNYLLESIADYSVSVWEPTKRATIGIEKAPTLERVVYPQGAIAVEVDRARHFGTDTPTRGGFR